MMREDTAANKTDKNTCSYESYMLTEEVNTNLKYEVYQTVLSAKEKSQAG